MNKEMNWRGIKKRFEFEFELLRARAIGIQLYTQLQPKASTAKQPYFLRTRSSVLRTRGLEQIYKMSKRRSARRAFDTRLLAILGKTTVLQSTVPKVQNCKVELEKKYQTERSLSLFKERGNAQALAPNTSPQDTQHTLVNVSHFYQVVL